MIQKKHFVFGFVFLCQCICAQGNAVKLDEVLVSDSQLRKFSDSQSVQQLNDSVINKNRPSLTSLLNYRAVIYFKENGYGMVSSPSFRGTSAQQAAVVWNGININSQFNGQTDFNTINTYDFQSISIRAGGGSVIYGSSAIGGSIHLNNEMRFGSFLENAVHVGYGSFATLNTNYQVKASERKWSFTGGFSHNTSDNDYQFPSGRRNLNGQYSNTSFNANFGYHINARNTIRFYSQIFDSERHFSLLTPTDSRTKYQDFNRRNLLEWSSLLGNFTSKVKLAHLSEEYRYFPNIDSGTFSSSTAETVIAKYDLSFAAAPKLLFNAIADYNHTQGRGSDIGTNNRTIFSGAILMNHKITDHFQYELGIRTEVTDTYETPFLFSAGANYKLTDWYKIKVNVSRNFRIPTFNDLYWLEGGNINLKPETSLQGEIGNEVSHKNWRLSATGYYNKITDMIQWLPGITTLWLPQNVNKVRTYGAEVLLSWERKIGNHQLLLNSAYAYTVSEEDETRNQLIYVPFYKATASAGYGYRRFSVNYQMLFNGEVFTRSDNNSNYNLDSYSVSNIGIDYRFSRLLKVGFQAFNLFDQEYQVVERRTYPGRNFTMNLTFKF